MSQTAADIKDVVWFVVIGLGLGGNAVVWTGFLLLRWSRPRPAKWDGKGVSRA